MSQISIQRISHVPSIARNPLTGSRRFQEGFNVYRLDVHATSDAGLQQKTIIFRSSLDHTRFGHDFMSWTSLQSLMEAENSKLEFYKTVRPERVMSQGITSFSSEEISAAVQALAEFSDDK